MQQSLGIHMVDDYQAPKLAFTCLVGGLQLVNFRLLSWILAGWMCIDEYVSCSSRLDGKWSIKLDPTLA